jgi:hypothetical protein
LNIAGALINRRYFVECSLPSRSFTRDWSARSVSSNVPVRLKFLGSPDRDLPVAGLQRFRAAWARMGTIADPAVERLHEVGGYEGYTFAACEQIEGSRLAEFRRRALFTLEEILRLMLMAAGALESLHPLGLVHKSLSPASLWVLEHYERLQAVKLGDFCAVEHELLVRGNLNRLGRAQRFLAPEVLSAPASARASADLYSLGRILQWLMAAPRGLGSDPAGRQRALRRIAERATAREPARRYQLPAELIEELTRVLSGVPSPQGESIARRVAVRRPAGNTHRRPPAKARGRGQAAGQARKRRPGLSRAAGPSGPQGAEGTLRTAWLAHSGSLQRLFREILRGRGGLYLVSRRQGEASAQTARILDYYKYYLAYQGGALLCIPASPGGKDHFLFQKLLEPLLVRTRLLRRKDWQEARERFRAAFGGRAAELLAVHPDCGELLGASRGRPARKSAPAALRSLFLEYLRFLLSLRSPLAVVLREAQLLDPSSLRLLEASSGALAGLPVLVLGMLTRAPH